MRYLEIQVLNEREGNEVIAQLEAVNTLVGATLFNNIDVCEEDGSYYVTTYFVSNADAVE